MTALDTPKKEIEILLVWRKSALIEQLVQSFLATIARGFKDDAGEFKNIPVALEDSRAGHVPLPVSVPRGKTLLPRLQGGAAKRQRWNRLCSLLSFWLFGAVVRSPKNFSGCDEDDQFP